MKISELWLREWIGSAVTTEDLCQKLTMAGIEIESVLPVVGDFSGVVVAEVSAITPHPEADRLQVCTVNAGEAPISVVCGAKNVRVGMKVAFAREGAILPNGMKIRQAKLRGVVSHGMLCSASELDLAEESSGLLDLPNDAPIGVSLREYMKLDDRVLEVAITPNRGDCLSVKGLAYEIAALTKCSLALPKTSDISPSKSDIFPVVVKDGAQCPSYLGRIIRQVNMSAVTPIWLQERLRRSGMRCINPVVDVLNYVMLEFGQPMHAFDLAKLTNNICVRNAVVGESISLLDGRTVELNTETLVIADDIGPQAIAGVMGGDFSSVTLDTKDVFLESAFFQPQTIARAVRSYQAGSESAYRFERGVDPAIQRCAIDRATELILAISGGDACPVTTAQQVEYLPPDKKIILRRARLAKIVGAIIADKQVEDIFVSLGFELTAIDSGWEVAVPARRFDIKLEIDLIEEVIRINGYQKIIPTEIVADLKINKLSDVVPLTLPFANMLVAQNYHEVITYSFVDEKIQTLFDSINSAIKLINPINSEMNVMRTSLWPGLLNVLQHNLNRQQSCVRIFEIGNRFRNSTEQLVISGLASSNVMPQQWSVTARKIDFFTVKGDIENLLILSGHSLSSFTFSIGSNAALHPGQMADIYLNDQLVGVVGLLHPSLAKMFDLKDNVYLFELDLAILQAKNLSRVKEISKFPKISRDIAILVDESIPADQIQATISNAAGGLLQTVTVFDVYQGEGIPSSKKSMAFSLVLQDDTRTLTDDEVANLMQRVYSALQDAHAAELRSSI